MTIIVSRKIGILHRSSKEGSIKENEKLCGIEENIFHIDMITLRKGGTWKCPVCNIVTIADLKKKTIIPMLSEWGVVGLNAEIRKK